MKTSQHTPRHSLLFCLFAFCAAITLLAVTSVSVFADSVTIVDNAHVLDATQITNEASQLPNPVSIYTTKTFHGSTTAFDTFTTTLIGPNDSNLIVINIDTVHRHLAIDGGTQVSLNNDQYASAIQTFTQNFNNGDYTGATVAALQSLNTALAPPPDTNGYPPNGQIDSGPIQTSFPNSSSDFSTVTPFIFTGLAIIFVVVLMRALARATVGGGRSRPRVARNAQPLDATPFEAGAIGTMAGEMAGYELGREEMDRQNREHVQQQMFNNNNGNFGGGDFGGGNMGGGSNIGGGSSGNF
jgi:uncharacterized membrane protein YgcG